MASKDEKAAPSAPPAPSTAPSAPPAHAPPAVAGWSAYTTLVNGQPRWYFVNNATGVSSWTLPGPPVASAAASPPAARPRLEGWQQRQNEFVKKYYGKVKGPGPKDYKDDPRYKDIQ